MKNSEEMAKELMRAMMPPPKERRGPHFRMHACQNQGEFSMLFHIGGLMKEGKTDEISPSALSDLLHISRPSVTSTLNTLEQKGMIERVPSKEDRRKTLVALTQIGRNFLEERFNEVLNGFKHVSEKLGEEKTGQLIDLLKESFSYMEEYHKNLKHP